MFIKLNEACYKISYIAKFCKVPEQNSQGKWLISFSYAIRPWQSETYEHVAYDTEEERNDAFENFYEDFNKIK